MRIQWYPFTGILAHFPWYNFMDDFLGDILIRRSGHAIVRNRTNTHFLLPRLHRPLWAIVNGAPKSQGGDLRLPIGNVQQQTIQTREATGGDTWHFSIRIGGVGSVGNFTLIFRGSDVNNCMQLEWDVITHRFHLVGVDAGVPNNIDDTHYPSWDDSIHHIRVTFDGVDAWEVFYDDSSYLNGAYPNFPDYEIIRADNTLDEHVWLGYFYIQKS